MQESFRYIYDAWLLVCWQILLIRHHTLSIVTKPHLHKINKDPAGRASSAAWRLEMVHPTCIYIYIYIYSVYVYTICIYIHEYNINMYIYIHIPGVCMYVCMTLCDIVWHCMTLYDIVWHCSYVYVCKYTLRYTH